jgi:hypothetical protein
MSQSTISFQESDPPVNTADRSGRNSHTKVDSDEFSRFRVRSKRVDSFDDTGTEHEGPESPDRRTVRH